MNSQLVCVKGRAPEIKEALNVSFNPSYAKIKLVGYKVPSERDPNDNSVIVVPVDDALSGLLFVYCSLWPDSPIGVVASPAEIVCPDTTFPLFGAKVSGSVVFTIRDVNDQLTDVKGDFTVMIEFHK